MGAATIAALVLATCATLGSGTPLTRAACGYEVIRQDIKFKSNSLVFKNSYY